MLLEQRIEGGEIEQRFVTSKVTTTGVTTALLPSTGSAYRYRSERPGLARALAARKESALAHPYSSTAQWEVKGETMSAPTATRVQVSEESRLARGCIATLRIGPAFRWIRLWAGKTPGLRQGRLYHFTRFASTRQCCPRTPGSSNTWFCPTSPSSGRSPCSPRPRRLFATAAGGSLGMDGVLRPFWVAGRQANWLGGNASTLSTMGGLRLGLLAIGLTNPLTRSP